MERRYRRIKVYANTLGYSATVSEKVEDINEMFTNTEVKAIICSQGGQNSNAILPYIDYEVITDGVLVGGNLSTLVKLLNTEYCPNFNNKILFLEDYADESPLDEIDSKINILKQHKVFEKIKGLWIGYYEKDMEIAKFEDVIMNNLKEYTFPILKCNDFGHNCENVVISIGAKVKLDATNCEVEIIEKILN